jgi:hypothetical protein
MMAFVPTKDLAFIFGDPLEQNQDTRPNMSREAPAKSALSAQAAKIAVLTPPAAAFSG